MEAIEKKSRIRNLCSLDLFWFCSFDLCSFFN